MPLGEEDFEGVVETFWGSRSVHHSSHGFVKGSSSGRTGRLTSNVRDAVRDGSAGLGSFEKLHNVQLSGELLFFEHHGGNVAVDELRGFAGVDIISWRFFDQLLTRAPAASSEFEVMELSSLIIARLTASRSKGSRSLGLACRLWGERSHGRFRQ